AKRLEGMSGSEVRALFAAAARPGVISLAGGMPFVEAIPRADVLAAGLAAIDDGRAHALQYAGGQGLLALRERLAWLASLEGIDAPADRILVTVGGQQALDVVGKVFIDPGDPIVVEAPTYVGASRRSPRTSRTSSRSPSTRTGCAWRRWRSPCAMGSDRSSSIRSPTSATRPGS